ncbi:hypothetical protein Nepgr_016606 [Nepenthes gracilis]|uniref:Upstream activation factor subunit spp27 n=1 Tax=Nepenthes gracilis TaxID=150966 RepID=A0AAD3SMZ1_NEPGR|nr:hypothetical protein Nepgr_016606 [Nepenthes gracilis]
MNAFTCALHCPKNKTPRLLPLPFPLHLLPVRNLNLVQPSPKIRNKLHAGRNIEKAKAAKALEMVSDAELAERLREFLRSSDLNTTTNAIVRRRLEEDFGVDLSERKPFIRQQVDLFLQSQLEESDEYYRGEREAEYEERDDVSGSESEGDRVSDGEEIVEGEAGSGSGRGIRKGRSHRLNKKGNKSGDRFAKLCALSPQLQKFLGVSDMAKTEVVERLWNYIRDRNLQDPFVRKNIICDDLLRGIFGVDSINMFRMTRALSKHIWPLDSYSAPAKATQKETQRKQERDEDTDKAQRKGKRQKGKYSGFLAPVPLSESLAKFLGTGESELTRAVAIKRLWDYIKINNLQDPSDKRRVICDEKLKELFDVDSFHGFTISKLLSAHLLKV